MKKKELQEYKERALDAFAKTVIRNMGITLYRKEALTARHQVSMDSYGDLHNGQLLKNDIEAPAYPCSPNSEDVFCVHSFVIHVSNAELAHALHLLKPKLRDVILLSSFSEMTNLEIAALLGIPKSTLHDRKKAALRRLHIHLTGKRG